MAKQKKSKAEKTLTGASKWRSRFETARDTQEPLFAKIAKYYDIKYATFNTDNMAPWRSKVYIPILASKADDMLAKLYGLSPGFDVIIQDETPEGPEEELDMRIRQEKARDKLKFDYSNPLLEVAIRDKLQDILTDSVIGGTGIGKAPWRVMKKEYKARPVLEDGVNVDMDEEITKTVEFGYNDIEPVNIFNFFIEPNATSLQKAEWVIIREWVTLDYLEKKRDSGEANYKNLEDLKDINSSTDAFDTYNQSRNRVVNMQDEGNDETVDKLELFECYEKETNQVATFVTTGKDKAGWTEIESGDNPYWHGKYPLVAFYTKRKPFQFWGESIFETTERIQSAVNDIFNHYMDNWNLSIDGMIMQEEGSFVEDFVVEPGGEFTYRGDQPKQFKFPEPNPTQLSIVMDVLEKSIEGAVISQFSSGVPDSSMDKTAGTATGIIRLQEAANDKIGYMKANFKKSMRDIGQFWLFNSQQFMDRAVEVPTNRNGQEGKSMVTPADMQGVLELRISDSDMEPLSKEQQKVNDKEWLNSQLQLQQASIAQSQLTGDPSGILVLNFKEISQESSRVSGKENHDRFISDQPAQVPPQEGQPGSSGGMQGEIEKMLGGQGGL